MLDQMGKTRDAELADDPMAGNQQVASSEAFTTKSGSLPANPECRHGRPDHSCRFASPLPKGRELPARPRDSTIEGQTLMS
jgi:hypothetical protein